MLYSVLHDVRIAQISVAAANYYLPGWLKGHNRLATSTKKRAPTFVAYGGFYNISWYTRNRMHNSMIKDYNIYREGNTLKSRWKDSAEEDQLTWVISELVTWHHARGTFPEEREGGEKFQPPSGTFLHNHTHKHAVILIQVGMWKWTP
jgi:hypothetical protein